MTRTFKVKFRNFGKEEETNVTLGDENYSVENLTFDECKKEIEFWLLKQTCSFISMEEITTSQSKQL